MERAAIPRQDARLERVPGRQARLEDRGAGEAVDVVVGRYPWNKKRRGNQGRYDDVSEARHALSARRVWVILTLAADAALIHQCLIDLGMPDRLRAYCILLRPVTAAAGITDWPPLIRVQADGPELAGKAVIAKRHGEIACEVRQPVAAWWTDEPADR